MKLGWIGLGDMGQVIIPRLLEAGHEVTGWNRTASKADALIEKRHGVGGHTTGGGANDRTSSSRWSPTPRRSKRSHSAMTE